MVVGVPEARPSWLGRRCRARSCPAAPAVPRAVPKSRTRCRPWLEAALAVFSVGECRRRRKCRHERQPGFHAAHLPRPPATNQCNRAWRGLSWRDVRSAVATPDTLLTYGVTTRATVSDRGSKVTVSPLLGGQLVVCHTLARRIRRSVFASTPPNGFPSARASRSGADRSARRQRHRGHRGPRRPRGKRGKIRHSACSSSSRLPNGRCWSRRRPAPPVTSSVQVAACACSSSATIIASGARWPSSDGWDILFASDDFAVHEALENIRLDAVIAEGST